MSRICPVLHRVEMFMLATILSIASMTVPLLAYRGASLDLPAYATLVAIFAFLLVVASTYRLTKRSEPIAAATFCTALFGLFSLTLSVFNYLLLPHWSAPIDPWLIAVDARLGYHWPDVMAWAARHPFANEILRWAYNSTLVQFAVLIVWLGLSGRLRDLYEMMAIITVSGMGTVLFWALFPSLGTSPYFVLPADVLNAVRPVVGPEYGAELLRVMAEGTAFLSPTQTKGLIAFPSYHTVLALTAAYACRNLRSLFPLYLVLNATILPAVLVHGGHHLVDIAGGLAMFAISWGIARAFVVGGSQGSAEDTEARPTRHDERLPVAS